MTKRYFWAVAAICAISRFATLARSPWEWDEALFSIGMRAYDVAAHHPHPPGFPAYIGLARLARVFVSSDFRALQAINVLAGMLLFPAVFLLARAAGVRFETALIGSALCAFIPNVWIFGGTAFSDVASLTLSVLGAALLLDERSSAGAIVLAIAIGVRPQNILVGLYPSSRKRVAGVAAIVGAIAMYAVAAYVTGFSRFIEASRDHATYIAQNDSFRNPDRPPLWQIFDRFFIKQYSAPALSIVMSLLVIIGVVAAIRDRDRAFGRIALTFGPFAIFAWLMLDRFSISRYSIGYMPLFTLLAAEGLTRIARRYALVAGAALILAFAIWTWPAAVIVRQTVSPPVAAVEAIHGQQNLHVAAAMIPFVEDLAPNVSYVSVIDERALPLGDEPAWLLAEIDATKPAGFVFHRDRDPLWRIVRHRYFDAALEPMTRRAQFVSGWSAAQRQGVDEWRTMETSSKMILPAAEGGGAPQQLRIVFFAPADHGAIEIRSSNRLLDRITDSGTIFDRTYEIPADGTLLEISAGRPGIRLRNLSCSGRSHG